MVQSSMRSREAYRLLFPNYPDVVNILQLCEMLGGISRKTAYKLMRDNEIAHLKVGRTYKIPKCHVIAYLQNCGVSEQGKPVLVE